MNTHPAIPDDLDVEDLMATALDRHEPVPEQATMLAYGAFQMAKVNEILAELTYDSAREGDLVLTRGGEGEARLLTFSNEQLSIEITLFPDRRTVVGEIAPSETPVVDLESKENGNLMVEVDEFGRFSGTLPVVGAFRIRVPGQLVTPWIDPTN